METLCTWLIFITLTSKWAQRRLKSPAPWLFTQLLIKAQIKENIKAPRHWSLCRKFTGKIGEFTAQRASNAENVSIWWRHNGEENPPVTRAHKRLVMQNYGAFFFLSRTSCWADDLGRREVKFESKYKMFHLRKCIWKYRLRNGGHFVQGEMSWPEMVFSFNKVISQDKDISRSVHLNH